MLSVTADFLIKPHDREVRTYFRNTDFRIRRACGSLRCDIQACLSCAAEDPRQHRWLVVKIYTRAALENSFQGREREIKKAPVQAMENSAAIDLSLTLQRSRTFSHYCHPPHPHPSTPRSFPRTKRYWLRTCDELLASLSAFWFW